MSPWVLCCAGPPKPDIWIPDSQGDCFVNELDFRQLGLILSRFKAQQASNYCNVAKFLQQQAVLNREPPVQ